MNSFLSLLVSRVLDELKDIVGQLETGDVTNYFVYRANFYEAKVYRYAQFDSLVFIAKFERDYARV